MTKDHAVRQFFNPSGMLDEDKRLTGIIGIRLKEMAA